MIAKPIVFLLGASLGLGAKLTSPATSGIPPPPPPPLRAYEWKLPLAYLCVRVGEGGGACVKSACIMNEFMNANIKLNAKELVPCLPLGKPQNT